MHPQIEAQVNKASGVPMQGVLESWWTSMKRLSEEETGGLKAVIVFESPTKRQAVVSHNMSVTMDHSTKTATICAADPKEPFFCVRLDNDPLEKKGFLRIVNTQGFSQYMLKRGGLTAFGLDAACPSLTVVNQQPVHISILTVVLQNEIAGIHRILF